MKDQVNTNSTTTSQPVSGVKRNANPDKEKEQAPPLKKQKLDESLSELDDLLAEDIDIEDWDDCDLDDLSDVQ